MTRGDEDGDDEVTATTTMMREDDDAGEEVLERRRDAVEEAMKYVYDPNREGSSAFAGAKSAMMTGTPPSGLKVMTIVSPTRRGERRLASAEYYEDEEEEEEKGSGNEGSGGGTMTKGSMYDLNFRKRGRDLIRVISTEDASTAPDVVCLQEVDHYHDFFEPELRRLGYAGIYKEDQWSPCRKFDAPNDGVAIFYKMDKLELLFAAAPGVPDRGRTTRERRREDAHGEVSIEEGSEE